MDQEIDKLVLSPRIFGEQLLLGPYEGWLKSL